LKPRKSWRMNRVLTGDSSPSWIFALLCMRSAEDWGKASEGQTSQTNNLGFYHFGDPKGSTDQTWLPDTTLMEIEHMAGKGRLYPYFSYNQDMESWIEALVELMLVWLQHWTYRGQSSRIAWVVWVKTLEFWTVLVAQQLNVIRMPFWTTNRSVRKFLETIDRDDNVLNYLVSDSQKSSQSADEYLSSRSAAIVTLVFCSTMWFEYLMRVHCAGQRVRCSRGICQRHTLHLKIPGIASLDHHKSAYAYVGGGRYKVLLRSRVLTILGRRWRLRRCHR